MDPALLEEFVAPDATLDGAEGAACTAAARSGRPSHRYKPSTATANTAAPSATGQGTAGSGPKRGILRSHGSITMTHASAQSIPAKNQKSGNLDSP
jgi:hypothetical protein